MNFSVYIYVNLLAAECTYNIYTTCSYFNKYNIGIYLFENNYYIYMY